MLRPNKMDSGKSTFFVFCDFWKKKFGNPGKWTKINVQIRDFNFFYVLKKKRMRLKCRDLKIKKKNFVTIKFLIKKRIPKTASFV